MIAQRLLRTLGVLGAALVVTLGTIAPASAQADAGEFQGVLYIWIWILVVGVAAMIIGTSLAGAGRGKR
jgi:hypothetical protein